MENTEFTPEKLMDFLTKKYAYLNDNGVKAKEVYDRIMASQSN